MMFIILKKMTNKFKKYEKPYISAEPLDAEILSGIGVINSEPHDPEEALGNSFDFLDEDDQELQNEKNWDCLLDQI